MDCLRFALHYLMVMPAAIRYFFEVPPLRGPELEIHGIGIRERMHPGIIDRPGGTGDCLFMFFYQPTLVRGADGTRLRPANTLVLWPLGNGHYYGTRDGVWMHSWVHCAGRVVAELAAGEGLPFDQPMFGGTPALIEGFLLALHTELADNRAEPDAVIVRNLFHNWFREVRRVQRTGAAQATEIPRRLLEARLRIEADYADRLTLADLAHDACLSVPHFCAEFKRHFGVAPIEYVIRLRLQHAAYLLRDRNLRVTDVAHQVGYPDIFYFSRLFKRRQGLSPNAFRRRATRA